MHEPWSDAFPQPTSIEEAELRLNVLIADIEKIQEQLGARRRCGTDGHDWRPRACTAQRIKRVQLRALKAWLKTARPLASQASTYALLRRLYGLVSRWAEAGVTDLTDEDEQLLTAVEAAIGVANTPTSGATQC